MYLMLDFLDYCSTWDRKGGTEIVSLTWHILNLFMCVFLRSLCVCMCAWGYMCVHVSCPLVGVYILNQSLGTGEVLSQGYQCVKGLENAKSVLWEYVSQFNCSYRFSMLEGSVRQSQRDIRAQLWRAMHFARIPKLGVWPYPTGHGDPLGICEYKRGGQISV